MSSVLMYIPTHVHKWCIQCAYYGDYEEFWSIFGFKNIIEETQTANTKVLSL